MAYTELKDPVCDLIVVASDCDGSATASQAPTPTRPGFHAEQPSPLAG